MYFFAFRDPGAEQKFKDISNAYEVRPIVHNEAPKFHLFFVVVGLHFSSS